jgi:nucleotide-binding universal stress UspA family protein
MQRIILVPLDGSKETEAILPEIQRIATERDQVHFLHVVPPVPTPAGVSVQHLLGFLDQALAYLQILRSKWLPNHRGLDLVRAGEPAQEILGVALEKNVSLIAMATRGRTGLQRFLLGSVASEIVRKSQLPVLLVRPDVRKPARAIERILLAVEGTEAPAEILETVKSLAGTAKSDIVLFHAMPPVQDPAPQWAPPVPLSILNGPGHRLQDLADRLEEEGYPAWPVVCQGPPVEEIVGHAARLDVDLIALATHARTGLERIFEGSVAEGVLKHTSVPVLLQKPLLVRKPVLEGERHA